MMGLAPDGGLFVPERIPQADMALAERLAGESYAALAGYLAGLFFGGDFDSQAVQRELDGLYDFPVPLRVVGRGRYTLELFHGPTCAFKDFGAGFMGRMTGLLGAAEKGITWNDDMQKELDSTMDTLASYAKSAGKSEGEYLKQLYGSNMTKKIFQGILKDTIIASHYQQDYIDSLTYTDDELQKYYEENKNSFDVANYEMITFNGAAASTKDADGNTVQPTEEESAAALQKAKDAANAALEQVKGGELLAKVAKDYEPIGTYSHPEAGTYSGNAATKWVFDESRQEGDTEIVENGTSIYLLVFHSRTRNDYNTVDVRHILFKVDTTGLDSKAEDYQAKLEELKAGKKQEAENALQAWKDGDATEDSFAALANQLSDDTGSNTNGGLYKQVYKNQMVTGFNDWCFDESRKTGDTGIVENDGNYIGYHVMYFVGTDDPYWMVQVRNAMTNKAYSEWSANLVKDITATENSGMKYVG